LIEKRIIDITAGGNCARVEKDLILRLKEKGYTKTSTKNKI
jgi:hypothetical protein